MTRPYSFQREILLILEEKLHILLVQVRNNLILVLHVKKNSGSRGRQSHSAPHPLQVKWSVHYYLIFI